MHMMQVIKRLPSKLVLVSLACLLALSSLTAYQDIARAEEQTRELSSGVLDSSRAQGPNWTRVDFRTNSESLTTLTLNWAGTADLNFSVFLTSPKTKLITSNGSDKPKQVTLDLEQDTDYYAGIWSSSGASNYTFTITEELPNQSPAACEDGIDNDSDGLVDLQDPGCEDAQDDDETDPGPSTTEKRDRTLLAETADSTNATGAKWRRVNFTTDSIDETTLSLSWVGGGNMLFSVFESSSNTRLAYIDGTENPKQTTLNLQTDTDYHAGVWVTGGVADFEFVITETFEITPPPVTQCNDEIDNDSDGLVDLQDPGCEDAQDDDETDPVVILAACEDGIDNDSDGLVDLQDPGCEDAQDDDETDPVVPTQQPNIIVINTDDQRADSIRHLPKIRQWLGDAGTTYTDAYVSTPSCCPSRATLMSGRYVHNNGQIQQQNEGFDLDLTIQRYLKDAGYFTGHAGKFLHWLPLSTNAPHWDRWTYFKGGYEDVWMRFDNETRRSDGYSTKITFERGMEYIDDFESRDDSKPFYLHLTPVAPHSPSTPEPQYENTYVEPVLKDPSFLEADRSDKPPYVQNRSTSESQVQSRYTEMTRTLFTVDDQVDLLMKHLEATGEIDNTLVIFTSDNGYMMGEHHQRSKFLPYAGSVDVPLLIRWPGVVPAGVVDDSLVTHVDIAPTILDAAGVTQNSVELDGHSVLPGVVHRTKGLTEYYYDPNNGNNIPNWASVTTETYRYAEYYQKDPDDWTNVSFREYYDLVNDPYELVNLFGDSDPNNDPEIQPLSDELRALQTCVGSACIVTD